MVNQVYFVHEYINPVILLVLLEDEDRGKALQRLISLEYPTIVHLILEILVKNSTVLLTGLYHGWDSRRK